MLKYDKLFALLESQGRAPTNWLRQNGIHAMTVNALRKGESVRTESIDKICSLLDCQPGDIMEYVPETVTRN